MAPGPRDDPVQGAVEHDPGWKWLDPEPPSGSLTIDDVLAGDDWAGRSNLIERWARDVWMKYGIHHDLVRESLDTILGD